MKLFLVFLLVSLTLPRASLAEWISGKYFSDSGTEMNYLSRVSHEGSKKSLLVIPDAVKDMEDLYDSLVEIESDLLSESWNIFVVLPPENTPFHSGGEVFIPKFLNTVRGNHGLEDTKFSILGLGKGGRGAFRVFAMLPDSFHSITVAPGYPSGNDLSRLKFISSDVRATFFIGAADKPADSKLRSFRALLDQKSATHETKRVRGTGTGIHNNINFSVLREALFHDE